MPSLASAWSCWTACASTWAVECRSTARPSSLSTVTGSTTSPSATDVEEVAQLAVDARDDDGAVTLEELTRRRLLRDRSLASGDGDGDLCRHGWCSSFDRDPPAGDGSGWLPLRCGSARVSRQPTDRATRFGTTGLVRGGANRLRGTAAERILVPGRHARGAPPARREGRPWTEIDRPGVPSTSAAAPHPWVSTRPPAAASRRRPRPSSCSPCTTARPPRRRRRWACARGALAGGVAVVMAG